MVGEPPIGTENTFRPGDPDERPEQRQRQLDEQYPVGEMVPGRGTPIGGADLQDRADAIVRREGGVSGFENAEREDATPGYRVEDFPGQDNPEAFTDPERDADRDGDDLPDAAGNSLRNSPFIPLADNNRSQT